MEGLQVFFALLGLLPLLALAGIVVGVAALLRRREGGEGLSAAAVRQFFFYGVAFVALFVAGGGVHALLAALLPGGDLLVDDPAPTAIALAAVITGAPVWLLFRRLAARSAREHPGEAWSSSLYLYGVLTVSAALFAGFAIALFEALLDLDARPEHIGGVVAWGAVWGYHWRVHAAQEAPDERDEWPMAQRRLYLYAGAGGGLAVMLAGAGVLLAAILDAAYGALFTTTIAGGAGAFNAESLRIGASLALVGAPAWWWHWLRAARDDERSWIRQWLVYGLGVFGGTATAVAFAGLLLGRALYWALEPQSRGVAQELEVAPVAVAGLAASVAAWGYHAWVARNEEGLGPGTQGMRAYRYLMAAVGLGTLAVGTVYLLAALIGLAAPSGRLVLPDVRWWSGEMSVALAALLVGGPLWAYQWRRLQRQAESNEERRSLPRRLTIFTVFGASVLSAMGAFIALLSMLLLRLFEGELTAYVFQDVRWAVAVLLTAGAVGGYYAVVLREDRAAAPERPASAELTRKRVMLVAGANARALADDLRDRTGWRITLLERTDTSPAPDVEADSLIERVAAALETDVLVVLGEAGAEVISYRQA
ncbi:MAG: DUF5671 domain-containing protein [Chloroflexota bacterium]|nr:DUF5671 domain-containing protein [Chloroflexota bacterium]